MHDFRCTDRLGSSSSFQNGCTIAVVPINDAGGEEDLEVAGFGDPTTHVVQPNTKVIDRCLMMSTDAGDRVVDPICGAGV